MNRKAIKTGKWHLKFQAVIYLSAFFFISCSEHIARQNFVLEGYGAVIRKDTTRKMIHLAFTGHDFAEGFPVIREVLERHGIKGSFFFTGDFYRNPVFKPLVWDLLAEGHYLGAHSDKHLLYCSWENRDSLLVDRKTFFNDLDQNYAEMQKFGISRKVALWFMPPYEWYNRAIARWTGKKGLILVNFSPGTRSNADYTFPEMGERYVSSKRIMESILEYEKKYGMNGFILLIHPGTDPRRTDKFYHHLDSLLHVLENKGYGFGRIDE
ncbi:MAG: polysaccharide deacetylase family protein [Cyclobacteriaceae bacterium]|nr:polysaccharide deacetylase family protein [Cyclobacteriaceae bacterium]